MIPTAQQADDTARRLRRATLAEVSPTLPGSATGKVPAIEDLLARFRHHMELDLRHPSQPDGYPTTASGGDSGGGRGPHVLVTAHDDPTIPAREQELVPVTGTEAAVFARQRWKDEHQAATEAAYVHLVEAAHHLAAASSTLNRSIGVTAPSTVAAANEGEWCTNHLKHHVLEPRAEGRTVCRWCQDIRSSLGDFPNRDLVDYRARYGRRLPDNIIRKQFPNYRAAG